MLLWAVTSSCPIKYNQPTGVRFYRGNPVLFPCVIFQARGKKTKEQLNSRTFMTQWQPSLILEGKD